MQTPPYRKVYIDVYTLMRKDGTVLPRFFIWEDGVNTAARAALARSFSHRLTEFWPHCHER